MCNTDSIENRLKHERYDDLLTTVRLLHSKIPIRIDQQRILELFPLNEVNFDKLLQMIHYLKTS